MNQNDFANEMGSDFSDVEEEQPVAEVQKVANLQEVSTEDVSDALKNKVDNYNFDAAISELSSVIDSATHMYQQLKKIKFDYLVLCCEVHSRVDFPSIMMETCRKEITSKVPRAKTIESLNF